MELRLRNTLEEIPRLLDGVEAFVEGLEGDPAPGPATGPRLGLCLDEAITNVISYAFPEGGDHEIIVSLIPNGDEVIAEIIDDGIPHDPLARPDPVHVEATLEDRPIGGLGIHLIRKLSRSVAYRHEDGKNHLTFHIAY
ncbi:MAG: ATP-binding protein [Rhodospirillum sp.]|nr:ATP-binding protein [Rhodospirillum sp.]MCF8488158.1 ATP-binding protein [Rhodospirillum sp.]MCF8503023.1 ATP-binding protein [Rhodospirillum sp.]